MINGKEKKKEKKITFSLKKCKSNKNSKTNTYLINNKKIKSLKIKNLILKENLNKN